MEKFPVEKHRVGPTVENIARKLESLRILQRQFIHRFKEKVGLIGSISWQADNFDLSSEFAQRKGNFIEVGGPTPGGFQLVPKEVLDTTEKDYFVSNVYDGLYKWVGDSDSVFKAGDVDIVADAKQLPFVDKTLGAVFASCLPMQTREDAMREAHRVLEDGGLLVWQRAFKDDLYTARELGLELVVYEWEMPGKVLRDITANPVDIDQVVSEVVDIAREKGLATHSGMGAQDISLHLYAPNQCIFKKI